MAGFYHLAVDNILRSEGRSCVQMASYISGSVLKDQRTGEKYYHNKKNEVENDEIYLPDCAPLPLRQELERIKNDKEYLRRFRQNLWGSLERYEKTNDAMMAKALNIAYPYQLSSEERAKCRDQFVREITKKGYAVEVADHLKEKNKNPHFHVLISVRQMDEKTIWSPFKERRAYVCYNDKGERRLFDKAGDIEKFNKEHNESYKRKPYLDKITGKQKIGKRNEKLWEREKTFSNPITEQEWLETTRKNWEIFANQYLLDKYKISSDSYEKQGINKVPKIHEGPTARRMGDKSDRHRINQQIDEVNKELESIDGQLQDIKDIREDVLNNYPREINVESFIEDVRREEHHQHLNLVKELTGSKTEKKHKSTYIPYIYGLGARQREIEEEIEKHLEEGKEDDEKSQ